MPQAALKDVFTRLIARTGPISLAHYMAEANARYYASRDPLGSAGDFVTAPEISQMFGEMIGIWLADMWQRAGRPAHCRYVELGPGRGTLARDALGAAARFGLQPAVHFVEASPALRDVQRRLFPDAHWHDGLDQVPDDGPLLLVANEFLDALPIRQLVRTAAGWRERMVGLVDGRLAPVAGDMPMDAALPADLPAVLRDAAPGTIIETSPAIAAVCREIGTRLVEQGGAALLVDYGTAASRSGSTFQAVRAHRKVDPFDAPGEADLTAWVDFAAARAVIAGAGARCFGPVEQGHWLRALGIETRAAALAARQPGREGALAGDLARLIDADQMGSLFKVLGVAAPGWPEGAGF